MRALDLLGKKFGRLTVMEDAEIRQHGSIVWLCRCECGRLAKVRGSHLQSGATKSCGCLQKDVISRVNTGNKFSVKHGEFLDGKPRSRLYRIWDGIKGRCNNSNNIRFHRYGGRGIKICQGWQGNFLVFKQWALLSGYQTDLTIDRIDNDGDYEPSNCRWVTKSENSKKRGVL